MFLEYAALQDLESSEDLAKKLNELFPEDQIYRYTYSQPKQLTPECVMGSTLASATTMTCRQQLFNACIACHTQVLALFLPVRYSLGINAHRLHLSASYCV